METKFFDYKMDLDFTAPTPEILHQLDDQNIRTTKLLPFNGIIFHFCEFFESAIHMILHERGVYPKALFKTVRKFNTPTKACSLQKITDFIRDSVLSLGENLLLVRRR